MILNLITLGISIRSKEILKIQISVTILLIGRMVCGYHAEVIVLKN